MNALNARATSAPTCSYGCGSRSSTAGVCVCARARALVQACATAKNKRVIRSTGDK